MEIGLFVFSLGLLFFAMSQQKKINYLSDENNQADIKALSLILDHDAEGGNDDEEEEAVGKPSTGTKAQKNREQQEAEQLIKDRAQEEKMRLRKTVPMSYVDCDYYYSYNTKFFMVSLVFVLFQGMINNSCIDIPSLFLI